MMLRDNKTKNEEEEKKKNYITHESSWRIACIIKKLKGKSFNEAFPFEMQL